MSVCSLVLEVIGLITLWSLPSLCNIKTHWHWFTMHYNSRQVAFDGHDICFLKFGRTGSNICMYLCPGARYWEILLLTIFHNNIVLQSFLSHDTSTSYHIVSQADHNDLPIVLNILPLLLFPHIAHSLSLCFGYGNFFFILRLIFTTRCYASVVLAVIVCLSICLSVCHKSELYKDG